MKKKGKDFRKKGQVIGTISRTDMFLNQRGQAIPQVSKPQSTPKGARGFDRNRDRQVNQKINRGDYE